MEDLPQRFGKYFLLRRVAVGGMAEIFLAVEKTTHGSHRFVTIKRIKADFDRDDEYVQFFLTEGRVSLKCAHPNLPQAFEMGAVDGSHYLALEYIHGHTLLDVVRAGARHDRPLSIETAVHVGVCVAAALEHAHGLRDLDGQSLLVVHRDVTPQNVMISTSGAVKLIDFGIVRSAVQTHRTASGVVKGKFSYMAPESLTSGHEFDHRADLFSLGIVLHETLTGRSLFRGVTDNDTLRRVRTMPIPDVTRLRPDTPPGVAAVIARALERDPDRRFQTATDFLHALEEAAEAAHIHRSMTRLRDEVLDRCGEAPFASLTEEEHALIDAGGPGPDEAPAEAVEHAAVSVGEPTAKLLHDALARALVPAIPPYEPTAAPPHDPVMTPPFGVQSAPLPATSHRPPMRLPLLAPPEPTPTVPARLPPASPSRIIQTIDPVLMPVPLARRDPQLAYFLRKAGILPPGRRLPGEPSDPDLAALLAALDP
ncbi:MAG TPA: protein kinase [Kofleriaceae bacterium]|nr:protein kinase [Kofleriaceae bacterium]